MKSHFFNYVHTCHFKNSKLQLVGNGTMHACSTILCLKLSFFSLKHTFFAETVIYLNFSINFSKSLFKSCYADAGAIIILKQSNEIITIINFDKRIASHWKPNRRCYDTLKYQSCKDFTFAFKTIWIAKIIMILQPECETYSHPYSNE